ncbi:MAG TPA: hypothetical protein VF733_01425, partial [Candidatus Saccharimonadales bacterium]
MFSIGIEIAVLESEEMTRGGHPFLLRVRLFLLFFPTRRITQIALFPVDHRLGHETAKVELIASVARRSKGVVVRHLHQ